MFARQTGRYLVALAAIASATRPASSATWYPQAVTSMTTLEIALRARWHIEPPSAVTNSVIFGTSPTRGPRVYRRCSPLSDWVTGWPAHAFHFAAEFVTNARAWSAAGKATAACMTWCAELGGSSTFWPATAVYPEPAYTESWAALSAPRQYGFDSWKGLLSSSVMVAVSCMPE